jgi:hypothetical protein
MFGKTRHGRAYYCCYPAANSADRLDTFPTDHPKAIYVREDGLTEALDHVIATGVFGPERHALIQQGLVARPARQRLADTGRVEALRRQIADLTTRQDRLITELEATDPGDRTFRDRLRQRFDALETERADKATQLATLEDSQDAEPDQDLGLLDALSLLPGIAITKAPDSIQRKLYDALQLQIHYERPDQARFRITLTDDTAEMLNQAVTGTGEPTIRVLTPIFADGISGGLG